MTNVINVTKQIEFRLADLRVNESTVNIVFSEDMEDSKTGIPTLTFEDFTIFYDACGEVIKEIIEKRKGTMLEGTWSPKPLNL